MSREKDDERRLYQCARKYEKIVKQVLQQSKELIWFLGFLFFPFDELIEMMDTRTRLPKRRRVSSSSKVSNSAATPAASASQPTDNDVFVQTITKFLQELQANTIKGGVDCTTNIPDQE